MSQTVGEKMLLTEQEVGALCNFGRSTLRKYRESGQLIPLKFGKSVRYRKQDVVEFISRQVVSDGI